MPTAIYPLHCNRNAQPNFQVSPLSPKSLDANFVWHYEDQGSPMSHAVHSAPPARQRCSVKEWQLHYAGPVFHLPLCGTQDSSPNLQGEPPPKSAQCKMNIFTWPPLAKEHCTQNDLFVFLIQIKRILCYQDGRRGKAKKVCRFSFSFIKKKPPQGHLSIIGGEKTSVNHGPSQINSSSVIKTRPCRPLCYQLIKFIAHLE